MKTILFDFISKYITLTEEEKNALLDLDLFHSVKKGTILLSEGQKSKESYFPLKGCIRTYYILDGELLSTQKWRRCPLPVSSAKRRQTIM